jgi:hypothetical protein
VSSNSPNQTASECSNLCGDQLDPTHWHFLIESGNETFIDKTELLNKFGSFDCWNISDRIAEYSDGKLKTMPGIM